MAKCMWAEPRTARRQFTHWAASSCGALRRLNRDQEPPSPFVFTSERGAPFTTAGWRKMVARLGVVAKLGFKAHPHMFRHACGFQLANQGTDTRTLQVYLGHRNIQHTVRYTELSPTRFKNLWRDWRRLPDLCQESRADKNPMVWRIHRIAFVQSLLDDSDEVFPGIISGF
jgi:integrase